MPNGFLEHANITVSDPERSSALLQQLCGWHERWRGPSQAGGQSIHVGNDTCYIAFYTHGGVVARHAKGQPLNHLAVVVDDFVAAQDVVRAAGLTPFGLEEYDPGRRFYFFDWDGIEFEVVNYD
jgi:catechol 2,3-dioxygenase-like lactoylglutathione lyase family enzyme